MKVEQTRQIRATRITNRIEQTPKRSLIFFLSISRQKPQLVVSDWIARDKEDRGEMKCHGPLSFSTNRRKEWNPCSPTILRRREGGSTIRMVKVLRRRGRSGGAHIEGREGAACPDALCPDNDDDGDDDDGGSGHDVAKVPVPSWISLSVCR